MKNKCEGVLKTIALCRNLSCCCIIFILSLNTASPRILYLFKGGTVLYNFACPQHGAQHPARNKASKNAANPDKIPLINVLYGLK